MLYYTNLVGNSASERTTDVDAEAARNLAREPTVRCVVPHDNVAPAENANLVNRWQPLFFIHDSWAGRLIGLANALHHDTRAVRHIGSADTSGLSHLQVTHCFRMSHQGDKIIRFQVTNHTLDEVRQVKCLRVCQAQRVPARETD